MDVAPGGGADVAGDALPAPTEVVRGGDVREEREPVRVAEVGRSREQRVRLDDQRRLAVGLARLDEPGDAVEAQLATPRSS